MAHRPDTRLLSCLTRDVAPQGATQAARQQAAVATRACRHAWSSPARSFWAQLLPFKRAQAAQKRHTCHLQVAAGLCLDYHTPPLPCSTAMPTQKGTAGLTHSKLPARLHQPLLRVGTMPHNQGTCAPVEAGHDGRRVDDMRHAAAAQRLQVARRADRACRAAPLS